MSSKKKSAEPRTIKQFRRDMTPAPTRRTLATFKAKHDSATVIPNKIHVALERMKNDAGPEAYAYEQSDPDGGIPFSKLAGVGSVHLAQYRKQFGDHIVVIRQDIGSKRAPRRVWFATVKAALAARGGPAKPEDLE